MLKAGRESRDRETFGRSRPLTFIGQRQRAAGNHWSRFWRRQILGFDREATPDLLVRQCCRNGFFGQWRSTRLSPCRREDDCCDAAMTPATATCDACFMGGLQEKSISGVLIRRRARRFPVLPGSVEQRPCKAMLVRRALWKKCLASASRRSSCNKPIA
jgi:hypothetical protein